MIPRQKAITTLQPLFSLLEQRFALQLDSRSKSHLQDVCEHYDAKRNLLLRQLGEAGAFAHEDYAKAVLVSETARLMLREIDPWPRRKKSSKGKSK
jgi:hypothetical protein